MASAKPKKKNPRLASGRKRVRQDVKLNAANTSLRSKYRTAVKNVEKAVGWRQGQGDRTLREGPEHRRHRRRQGHLPQEQGIPRQEPPGRQGQGPRPRAKGRRLTSPGKPGPGLQVRRLIRVRCQQSKKTAFGRFFCFAHFRTRESSARIGGRAQRHRRCGPRLQGRPASIHLQLVVLGEVQHEVPGHQLVSRRSRCTTTHLMPSIVVGTHQGE
jgi:hypothetical protein